MRQPDNFSLRNDVEFEEDDGKHQYIIPFSEDDVEYVFSGLERALESLQLIGSSTSDDDYDTAFVYARRRFARVFETAYDRSADGDRSYTTRMPTVKNIFKDLYWYDEIPARTFTVEKTEDNIILTYEEGFHATADIVTIEKDVEDDLTSRGIRACGEGIKAEHAPYDPSIANKWRYNPSCVQLSIRVDEGDVKLGVSNDAPTEPLWYRMYKHISTMTRPYAYTTFDMHNQTGVVKFTYNQNQPEENHI